MRLQLESSLGAVVETWRAALHFTAVLRRFRPHLRRQRVPMLLATLASLGFMLVTLMEPWPLQVIFDGVLLGRPVQLLGVDIVALAGGDLGLLLLGAAAAVLLLAVGRGHLYYAQNVLAATAGQDVVMAVRGELFEHLQTLSMSFHRRSRAGDLLMRLTGDIVMLREMVVAALITLLTQGLVLLGILVVMATLNLRLTIVAVVVAPLLLGILSIFRLRLENAARKQRKREGRLASKVHEIMVGMQLVQAYTAEDHEAGRFRELNRRSLRGGVRLTRIEAQLNRMVQITMALGLCLILWLGTQDVLAERLSPGQLLVFMAYLRGMYRPLRQISKLVQRMAKASACTDRVLEVLEEVPEVRDPPQPIALRAITGRVALRGVNFAFSDGRPVLRGIDLAVEPREMVALVGPTGSGKTTLLSLIPRFFDPQAGEILIDDVPITSLRLKSLRRHISFLQQDTVVMGVTVAENIAYGARGLQAAEIPERKIRKMAKHARAHEFIRKLPRGYQTVVGERGATLSGGQRQRIAIARALLRKAPILLLDEPTAALDPVSAQAVLETLDVLTERRTTLVVAHQLGTVLRADRIVFLEGGRIVEQGSHEDLLRRGGRYAEFFHVEWGGLAARGIPSHGAPRDAAGPSADGRGHER